MRLRKANGMRYPLDTPRITAAVGALVLALAVAVPVGLTAVADEDDGTTAQQPERNIAEDGSIIPEPHPEPEAKDAIDSLAELTAYEKELDPAGSPAIYVCANEGDSNITVVEGHEAPADAVVNPDAGPVKELPDPCAGSDWVVGD